MFLPKPAEKSLWKPCFDPGAGRRENRRQWDRQTKGSCQQGRPSTVGQVTGFLPAGRRPRRRGESGRPPGATPRPVELGVLTSGLRALQEVQTPRGSTQLGVAWSGAALGAPSPCSVRSLPGRARGLWCHRGHGSAVSRRGRSHPDPSVLGLHPPGPPLRQCSWSQTLRWPPCLQGLHLQPSLWPFKMFWKQQPLPCPQPTGTLSLRI